MKISTVGGSGYVGLVTSACLAELGNQVTCYDINKDRIAQLQKGDIPFYEPELSEFVNRNLQAGRLSFTTDPSLAIKDAEVIFITVGTPSAADGSADLSYIKSASHTIAQHMNHYAVIVNKSTVPVGTGNLVSKIIGQGYKGKFDVVSNPEFLREGQAVADFMKPDRIVIGNGSEKAREIMAELYSPFDCPILYTDIQTAELIKYASNTFLAASISFINSLAVICESVGAEVADVAHGMRLDRRIGQQAFLNAGIGFGGSCFPKDVRALIQLTQEKNLNSPLLESIITVNETQRNRFIQTITTHLGKITNKRLGVWGLAFKPHTDDLREAPSLAILSDPYFHKSTINAYDPVVKQSPLAHVALTEDPYQAIQGADALLIFTEWDEFKLIDLERVKKNLRKPVIIDGRNIYSPARMKELGFTYISIGRPAVHP